MALKLVKNNRPALVATPRKRLLKPKRRKLIRPTPRFEPREDLSVDEQIHILLETIVAEVSEIDDPEHATMWLDALENFQRSGDVEDLMKVTEWKRPVVPLEEFMFSSAYLGLQQSQIYPSVVETAHHLDDGDYREAVFKGALGTGKTTLGNIMMARDVYKISCMRSPQTSFGIQAKSSIVFTIQSVRLGTAKKAVFDELGHYMRSSPYFMQKYPYNPNVTSEMRFESQNVRIIPVSSSNTAVISMNVIGGQLDEMNFMQKTTNSKHQNADDAGKFDQAKALYNTLSRRKKSRFANKGKLPGTLYLISSSRFPDDFTELKAAESTMMGGDDPSIYVYSHSQWSAKGRDAFMDEDFQMQVGNDRYRSRALDEDEEPDIGCETIPVPMDFHSEFVKDPDGSLRDFAGLTTLSTNPFFNQRHFIDQSMREAQKHGYENPFAMEQVDLTIGLPTPDATKLRTDVPSERHCHIDLGLSRDACGFAVGHLAGHKIIQTVDPVTKQRRYDIKPIIAYDVIMRILPPPNGEIQISDVRKLLTNLNDLYGLNITSVTTDGFQSTDTRQILKRRGFKTGYQSVEKVEPWRSFREALYDGRILMSPNQHAKKELVELETSIKNNKEKVDHSPNGTKDVADAIVGVANHILRQKVSWNPSVIDGGTSGTFLLGTLSEEELSEMKENETDDGNRRINRRPRPKRKRAIRRKRVSRKA